MGREPSPAALLASYVAYQQIDQDTTPPEKQVGQGLTGRAGLNIDPLHGCLHGLACTLGTAFAAVLSFEFQCRSCDAIWMHLRALPSAVS